MLQVQTSKADELNTKRSDYIITNVHVSSSSVGTIEGRQV